jgi:hypothetical protein
MIATAMRDAARADAAIGANTSWADSEVSTNSAQTPEVQQ